MWTEAPIVGGLAVGRGRPDRLGVIHSGTTASSLADGLTAATTPWPSATASKSVTASIRTASGGAARVAAAPMSAACVASSGPAKAASIGVRRAAATAAPGVGGP